MKSFLKIVVVFLLWRISLFLIGAVASNFFLYDPSFPYADGILDAYNLPQWLYSWANFDGVHYITIATKGYKGTALIQAFFPLFPYLSKLPNLLIDNIILSQLFISNLFFVILLTTWFYFVKERFSKSLAVTATTVLLLFPTSFFFVASYNESIFLTLVLLSFMSVEKKNYWLTALFIALASTTRIVGILLLPAILIDVLFKDYDFTAMFKDLFKLKMNKISKHLVQIKKIILKPKAYVVSVIIVSLGSLGLLGYMLYLHLEFSDALYFFHVQSEFGGVRQETLISYPQVIFRYLKILATARPFDYRYLSYLNEFITGILGLVILIYSLTKVRLSYVIFALSAFILPTLTGTFSSMPRYILVCFPIFLILSQWIEKDTRFKYGWFILSTGLLIINTMLFIQGYWVA